MSNIEILCDVLLVVLGVNGLVFLAVAQPGGSATLLLGAVGSMLLVVGLIRTGHYLLP